MFTAVLKKHAEKGALVRKSINRVQFHNLKGTELASAISEAKGLCKEYALDYAITYPRLSLPDFSEARQDLDSAISNLRK